MSIIHTLLIGRPQTMTDKRGRWSSAIYRQPTDEPIMLDIGGLAGDQVADTKHHGSADQAVCCHPLTHYDYWNKTYNLAESQQLGPGAVGENWTLTDITEADIYVGDIYNVGEAQVQVTAPRYPCSKQERKTKLPGFLRKTKETLRTGFYLRVLKPGLVQAGDELLLVARPQPFITLQTVNEHLLHNFEPELAHTLLNTPELAAGWKKIIRLTLEKQL